MPTRSSGSARGRSSRSTSRPEPKDSGFPSFRRGRPTRTVAGVTAFLAELYVSQSDPGAVRRGAERTRLAAEALTREGTPVRYLRSIFVPEDETCFHLCEAGSAEAIREVGRRASLPFERVAEVVAEPTDEEESWR